MPADTPQPEQVAPGADPRPVLNPEWLARMRAKPDFLRALFGNFLAEEPKRQAALRAAVEAGDLEQARYLAHSLKGAAASLGLERLRDACRELEFAARDGEAEAMRQALSGVDKEFAKVYAAMRAVEGLDLETAPRSV